MRDSHSTALWIFGYGSLIWRPSFTYTERQPAKARGWLRRFWQGSTDHRGTPGNPGRVVTLVPCASATCWGMAYRLDHERATHTLANLDKREQGGYTQTAVPLTLGNGTTVEALTYIASNTNPNYLGPASLEAIAEQISRSRGPSGANIEYLTRLADELRRMKIMDQHVFTLESLVKAETR